jgi:hypothetical protein
MGILDDILAGIEEPEDTKKKQHPAEPNTEPNAEPNEPDIDDDDESPWFSDEFRKAYKIKDQA